MNEAVTKEVLVMSDELATSLFDLFINRTDCYAFQRDSGGYVGNVAEPVTVSLIEKHLAGKMTIGTYQLDKESMVKTLIFDLDPDHLENIREATEKLVKACLEMAPKQAILLEASRWPDPSYHIYVFFLVPVPAKVARLTGLKLVKYAKLDAKKIEVFPKQDRLTEERPFGNFVKLPLGLHRVAKKWSHFLDLETFQPISPSCLRNVFGITFSDKFVAKVMNQQIGHRKAKLKLSKGFKPLSNKEEERIVKFLCRYWKLGTRNKLEISFLGWSIKKGISHGSARRIIEGVVERTGDEERSSRFQLVDYHYKNRMKLSDLKGISGLREIVREVI